MMDCKRAQISHIPETNISIHSAKSFGTKPCGIRRFSNAETVHIVAQGSVMHMKWLMALNEGLWQWLLPVLLPLTAILCGVASRMHPLRYFGTLLRHTYGTLLQPQGKSHALTQRQIFATALAATMGTGNLVGTAVAISLGGAGALFWLWISAPMGMLLVYAENLLGTHYRDASTKGTLAYLQNGVRSPMLAAVFAICCIGASIGMGNLAQSNAMASALEGIGIPLPVTGTVTAVLLLWILMGGSKRIGRLTEWLMPLLCGGYLLCCLWLILQRIEVLPGVFVQILQEAFGVRAMGSGLSISAMLFCMSIGLRRGIFSNEAGLGSSALLHGEGEHTSPTAQGEWAAAEVFADTTLCCTVTGLALLTAPAGTVAYGSQDGAGMLLRAFRAGFGDIAVWLLAICIALLAFATLIGWYGCGRMAFCYVFGEKHCGVYLAIYVTAAFCGALGKAAFVWLLCDVCNGCMALPNLYGLWRLLPTLRQITDTCKMQQNVVK